MPNNQPQPDQPAPKCACGQPRFLSASGYHHTCLSDECLKRFLGIKRRGKREGPKVERIEPSPAIANELPELLKRKMRYER